MTKQEYHQEAAECVRMAEQSTDPTTKLVSVGLAQAWLQLAELAESTAETRAGGETSETGDISQMSAQSLKFLDFVPKRVVKAA